MKIARRCSVLGLALITAFSATALWAAESAVEREVLILHTNDIHDHVRPGYTGIGGLPYVASYIRSVKAQQDNVLLLDAGDVREKGDWVAHLTEGQLIFEAMRIIGYDAVVPGNHDVKVTLEHLDKCEKWLGQPFICANILNPDGLSRYLPSRIFEVNGVRIGVIGLTRADKGDHIPDIEFSKQALATEAARIGRACHVLVALIHEGGTDAMEIIGSVPEIDIAVTGHTHQATHEPRVLEETGALIVQAGSEGYFVGRLELVVDIERGKIIRSHGELVAMDHDAIEPDSEVLAMVQEAEARHCPDASVVIGHTKQVIGMHEVARLAAEALRKTNESDFAIAMADKVVRNTITQGPIDVNALFRALAPWALEASVYEIKGQLLLDYLLAYEGTWERPQWSGKHIRFGRNEARERIILDSDLDPDTTYEVVVTGAEWERLLEPFSEGAEIKKLRGSTKTTIDALRAFITELTETDESLVAVLEQLDQAMTEGSPVALSAS